MSKTSIVCAGILLSALGLAVSAPTESTALTRQAIQREYNMMDAAFARKNLASAYAFYASNYQRTDLSGKTFDLASDRQGAQQFFPMLKSIHGSNRIQTITVRGSRAVVTVATHGEIVMQSAGSQKTTHLDDSETRSQVWIASGPMWLLQKSRTISSRQVVQSGGKTQVIVNGKVLK